MVIKGESSIFSVVCSSQEGVELMVLVAEIGGMVSCEFQFCRMVKDTLFRFSALPTLGCICTGLMSVADSGPEPRQ